MVTDRLATLIIVTSLFTSAVVIGVGGAASAADNDNSSFDAAITDINTSVVEGETMAIEAKITNTGSEEDTQQIHLKRNNSVVDSVKNPPLTLASGESTDVMLEWTPEYGEDGPTELAVQTNDHEEVRIFDVGEGPTFPVAIDKTSGPVTGGETLTVSVTVRNTGEWMIPNKSTPVELSVANELQAQKSVELASGETKQVDLTWETMKNDSGTRTVEVVSADAATELRVNVFDSTEVVSTDAATESPTVDVVSNDTETPPPPPVPGLGIGTAVIALLAFGLLGYGPYRN